MKSLKRPYRNYLISMRTNKKYFLLIIISVSLILLYCFFELFGFSQGIDNDRRRTLLAKKKYLIQTSFEGKVISKEICDKCSDLKWGVTIQLDTINELFSSTIIDRVYPPYYEFGKDNLLYMKVSKNIYNKIEIGNILIKDSESIYININNIETFQLLSEDNEKWFFDE